jgi:potassium-transporting ATPase KdpC subunit
MKQILISLRILFFFTIIVGGIYPLIITGLAQSLFAHKANGSLININGNIVGSEIIGQKFESARYFQGRPSASQYDALSSGGSNLGPSNDQLIKRINDALSAIRTKNALSADEKIPADLLTSSASGLDPHISLDSALMQAKRVASVRLMDESIVRKIIRDNSEKRYFNVAGDSFINVLKLNMALDAHK